MDKQQLRNSLDELSLNEKNGVYETPKVILPNVRNNTEKYIAAVDSQLIPVRGTNRSSEPENSSSGMMSKNSVLLPDFPIQYLKLLEYLAVFNRHVSYAIENIITLSNTPYTISFSDSVKDKDKKRMLERINLRINNWYEYSEGSASLINDLFAQAAINGAVSFEGIPTKQLDGIKKVVRISPKNIRFVFDSDNDTYAPFQLTSNMSGSRKLVNGMVQLNPVTYKYMAMRRFNESPYGVPPFLAAIEDLITEYDMLGNFKSMMKRLGILGFLSVLVKAPTALEGETDDEYRTRLTSYLDSIAPEVEKQMANGVAIGFKDTHEFKMEGQQVNVDGAENLMKIVKSLVFSGLKQDPNMHGENYSVTETFGRVLLAKLSTQMKNYQRLVGSALEQIILMDLVLAGENPGYVLCEFKEAMIGDEKRSQETEALKLKNLETKYRLGIISQQTMTNEAGYDKPALSEPIALLGAALTPPGEESTGSSNASPDTSKSDYSISIPKVLHDLKAFENEFDYSVPEDCNPGDSFANFHDSDVAKFISSYRNEVSGLFKSAIGNTKKSIGLALSGLKGEVTTEQFRDIVMFTMFREWQKSFINPLKPKVKNNVSEIFTHFRKDKTPFTDGQKKKSFSKDSFFAPPDSIFGLMDYRTIEFFEKFDNLYLGKFITDEDTRIRFKNWIEENYIKGSNPIGKNAKAIDEFIKEFGNVMEAEAWKIRRIIDTSVNMARNFASTLYLEQGQIDKYEIVEVLDQLTCKWCATMDGKQFDVKRTIKMIQEVVDGEPGNIKDIKPFVTSIPFSEFEKMDDQQLLDKGMMLPSYHCHCRGRIVALV